MSKEIVMAGAEDGNFNFEGQLVRVVQQEEKPWWVATDVCAILGLTNTSESMRRLDEEDKSTLRISEGGPEVNIVNESGLYTLILRSSKPEAKRFKKWVTSEVLPSIRQHGAYMTAAKIEEALTNPDTIIKLATDLKAERARRVEIEAMASRLQIATEEQAKAIKDMLPKKEYFDKVLETPSLVTFTEVAMDLKVSAIRLNKFLIDKEILYRQGRGGKQVYVPHAKYKDRDYFKYHTITYTDKNGVEQSRLHLKATQLGRKFIHELWESQFKIHPAMLTENGVRKLGSARKEV